MSVKKSTVAERINLASAIARNKGMEEGFEICKKQSTQEQVLARSGILKAAAELAQANAKLTYAMSRMIAEKGW
jgi:hypothetical protein